MYMYCIYFILRTTYTTDIAQVDTVFLVVVETDNLASSQRVHLVI